MNHNLRHLRVLLAVTSHGSISKAAEHCGLSQPAVTQAINKLEDMLGVTLFDRTPQGVFATQLGKLFSRRVERALQMLDVAVQPVAPRLQLTATASQLRAFIAVSETGNFTLAARKLDVAQPTVHRAVSQMEKEAMRPLLERTSSGILPTRAGQNLASAAHLMFAELEQGGMELADALGMESGRIVVGAMPLSRIFLLPKAVARFRERWRRLQLRVLDGPYDELVSGLRRGEIDFLVGALRNPPPIGDISQIPLFEDSLTIVARADHPLAGKNGISVDQLRQFPWAVAAAGTPTRMHFDRLFTKAGGNLPESIVESASLVFVRELLTVSDHLACVSSLQAEREVASGQIVRIDFPLTGTSRPIGITTRKDWQPTAMQQGLIDLLRSAI